MPSIASPVLHEEDGLAADSLSPLEVLAQSISGIAPSACAAVGPAVVAVSAGGSVIYAFIASTVVLLLVAWCVNQFVARKGPGTLMNYISSTFGTGAGFVGAIGLAFGYVLIAVAVLSGFIMYLTPLLGLIGISVGTGLTVVIAAVAIAIATVAMVRGIELSTRVGVFLEAVSIALLLILLGIILGHHGLSSAPFHMPHTTVSGTAAGMVLAIFNYVGFESAACMGTEASNASRSIPRAVAISAAIAGILYIFSSYVQYIGFGTTAALTASSAPLNDLATSAGVHVMGYVMDVGICLSFFACVIGSLNAASRLLHAMGERRLLHRTAGTTHRQHKTPHLAIYVLSAITFVIIAAMSLTGTTIINIYSEAATLGTYGYLLCYFLVALACPLMLWREGHSPVLAVLIGGLAAAGIAYVVYSSVYPVPAGAYHWMPYEFLGVLVVAVAWYLARGRADHRTSLAELTVPEAA
jgi:amino acid transporter